MDGRFSGADLKTLLMSREGRENSASEVTESEFENLERDFEAIPNGFTRLDIFAAMGASDWAGQMVRRLEAEFGTAEKRNLRITAVVRWFASNPKYEGLFDGNRRDEQQEWSLLTDDLPSVLREQPGSTIEERWNNLMLELEYQEIVEGGVYLNPWERFDRETYDPDVTHDWDGSW